MLVEEFGRRRPFRAAALMLAGLVSLVVAAQASAFQNTWSGPSNAPGYEIDGNGFHTYSVIEGWYNGGSYLPLIVGGGLPCGSVDREYTSGCTPHNNNNQVVFYASGNSENGSLVIACDVTCSKNDGNTYVGYVYNAHNDVHTLNGLGQTP